jgi:hypothetical protein
VPRRSAVPFSILGGSEPSPLPGYPLGPR